jgi:hypothetical protein
MKDGFVYLIKESGDDFMCKVGVTTAKDVNTRLKKLQTGNGNKLILLKSFKSNNPFKLEKMLHNYYGNNREEGEWFLLGENEINEFESLCNKYQVIIDSLIDNPFF